MQPENRDKPYKIISPHRFFDVADRIVRREVKSGNTVSLASEVDLTELETIRTKWQGQRKPTYTTFVVKAVALALREHPYANRRLYRRFNIPFLQSKLQQFNRADISVACERAESDIEVATFLDILRDADNLNLSEISEWLHALATSDMSTNKQWREFMGLITNYPSWLSAMIVKLPISIPQLWWKWRGGAVLISSPAKYGIDMMTGAWPSPLGLSFGFAKDRAVVRAGVVVPCKTFALSLNFDRRVMAGAQAARFFKRIVEILEKPKKEMAAFLS